MQMKQDAKSCTLTTPSLVFFRLSLLQIALVIATSFFNYYTEVYCGVSMVVSAITCFYREAPQSVQSNATCA